MSKFEWQELGLKAYPEVWELQRNLFNQALLDKKEGKLVSNQVLLVEHPPVYTLGKSADSSNVLLSEAKLGAKVFRIERGGDVTFHGPGQIVLYPIIDLEQFGMSLREYIYNVEEVIIHCIASYGLKGVRSEGASGVWLDVGFPTERKIAALGVKASRHITMHGLAFNVNTDLTWFQKINPCGFIDKGVSSLQKELGKEQNMSHISAELKRHFEKIFI